jgi:hypothetical protein
MPVAFACVASAASPTLDAAELAELETLVSPSDALDDACAALSFTAPAASDVVEALRTPARRTANVDCRSTARDAANDIVKSVTGVEMARGDGVGVVMSSGWHVELRQCYDFSDCPHGPCSCVSGRSGETNAWNQRHIMTACTYELQLP